ncbi:MAG: M3 family oligoendopeptidase [Chloroflexi bacterium]|nr:M3 family oligoendopeptidase [Chloroflexota bacterium]
MISTHFNIPSQPPRWSLDDLFPGADSAEFQAALKQLDEQVTEFEAVREQLSDHITPEALLDIIGQMEAISQLAYRVFGFASLWFSEDTQNQDAQSLYGRVQQMIADLTNRTLFFNLWWKALDDENAARLMAEMGDYRYWLEEMRHFKPHTLSEAEEKIINIKDVTGSAALVNLYETITNRYVFELEVDGEKKELTRGEVMQHVRSPDPDLRARAYQTLYQVYGHDGPILGQIYQFLVRDWRNEQVNLRHFDTPIAARNLRNDIPDEVVDLLLDVTRENAPLFQRYFRLKARVLGMERLRRYDIYAPVSKADKRYDFAAAANMVLDAFQEFDAEMAQLAERVFAENHLDAEVRKGKRSGAFCWSATPKLTPWVLTNYQGRAADISTLAHELGHAVHGMFASHHSIFTFHASLPLAETASTFGEMLLIDRLLSQEEDEDVRRDMLFRQVDDAYATIMRQVFFALFERTAHEMVHQGATTDELAAAYMENLQEQFGDAIDLSEEFRWEWVSIPHIYHTPFYVYAYAFGQLLVLALYRQYREEGEAFKARYLDILRAGGSDAPARILAAAGVDIHQRAFWQGGFDIIAEQISDLERMLDA